MIAVSVIVPVFNASKYLRQALDSLVAQTLDGIEFLCVNDESTDDSLSILREYEAKDPRFRVVDKPNGGYGQAMNTGIAQASGEYIGILEPDDFVATDMFSTLYAYAELPTEARPDVVKGSYYSYFEATDHTPPFVKEPDVRALPTVPTVGTIEDFAQLVKERPGIWSAIYRRDFLVENDIWFIEAKGAGWVDNPFLYESLCMAKSIVYVPVPLYYYRRDNPESSAYLKDYNIPLDRIDDIFDVIEKRAITQRIVKLYAVRRAFNYVLSIIDGMEFDEPQPELYERIHKLFSRFDRADVLENEFITKERKRFYLEILGLKASEIEKHEAVEDPELTIVGHLHNGARYVGEFMESVLSQESDKLQVIWQDEGGSFDATEQFIERIKSHDCRVDYRTKSAQSLGSCVSEWVYFVYGKHQLLPQTIKKVLDTVQVTECHAVVFGVEGLEAGGRVLNSSEALRILFANSECLLSDVCVRRELLETVLDSHYNFGPFVFEGQELLVKLLLAAEKVQLRASSNTLPIVRRHRTSSISVKPTEIDPKKTHTALALSLLETLKARGVFKSLEGAFYRFSDSMVRRDLDACDTEKRYVELVQWLRNTAIPELLQGKADQDRDASQIACFECDTSHYAWNRYRDHAKDAAELLSGKDKVIAELESQLSELEDQLSRRFF